MDQELQKEHKGFLEDLVSDIRRTEERQHIELRKKILSVTYYVTELQSYRDGEPPEFNELEASKYILVNSQRRDIDTREMREEISARIPKFKDYEILDKGRDYGEEDGFINPEELFCPSDKLIAGRHLLDMEGNVVNYIDDHLNSCRSCKEKKKGLQSLKSHVEHFGFGELWRENNKEDNKNGKTIGDI